VHRHTFAIRGLLCSEGINGSEELRTEDGCVIQECLNGEPEAFGVLVDKYKAGIHAFAYSKLRDFHDAQDVVQEVFMQAYRNLHKLRRWESFPFWLYRIAFNRCKRWLRESSRRPDREFIEDQDVGTLTDHSIKSYHEEQMNEYLWETLNSLSESYREVLMLYYFGGMNSLDIARALGTSPTAIRHRLSRARTQLREEMVAMMDTAFDEQRLRASFTFRILEMVKQIKPQPVPRMTILPWGVSLATGVMILVMGLSPHLGIFGAANTSRNKAADAGMLCQTQAISGDYGDYNGGPDLQSVVLLTSQAEPDMPANTTQRQIITVDIPYLLESAKKLEMVLIQPGTFTMGARKKGDWPPHKVTITRPFYIGKYEVTQAQWKAVMGKNCSYFRRHPNHPVEKASWRACQKFIKRLNALRQGIFRLPTEAEWEYACRAGTETSFSFGSDLTDADRYMWWHGNNTPDSTKEVGLKLPNAWGIYDMHGNVHEWCSDRWESPDPRGDQIDPQGPSSRWTLFGFWTKYVFRGGCFNSGASTCRSASRNYEQSFDYYKGLGLRLVREYL
jgi:RNA polymerase sigma factor (sigma-70 family)